MRRHSGDSLCDGRKIALVPTMGFFHEGHLSLMRKGREIADELVVSVFVNPIQFSPQEDLNEYPRDFERDLSLARKEKVDVIFAPSRDEIYPEGFQTRVSPGKLAKVLCGATRTHHFSGVATVISKFFNIIRPHMAIFGRKDYQQLLLVRQMANDLDHNVKIVAAPTVRDPDGLAMSSRNNYLNPTQRTAALSLYESLKKAAADVTAGVRDADTIISEARKHIAAHPDIAIEYISVCHPDTLEDIKTISGPAIMALAATVGTTRLIDNIVLTT